MMLFDAIGKFFTDLHNATETSAYLDRATSNEDYARRLAELKKQGKI